MSNESSLEQFDQVNSQEDVFVAAMETARSPAESKVDSQPLNSPLPKSILKMPTHWNIDFQDYENESRRSSLPK